jgi:HNH endonuclease
MLRRSLRTPVRVGAAARRRIQRGGPRATGRPAASLEEWAVIHRVVFRRARWRCQACGRWGALEVHHVVKRAQGGSDFDLDRLVALCPRCHAQTDAPYVHGRLVVIPSGGGGFIFKRWEGTGKETSQVVETWESPRFPSTMEPARGLARSGHHRSNSGGSDADQARP